MNISLTKELEALVGNKVASGRYHTASEVVREGLRLLEERDLLQQARLEQLKLAVSAGIEQMDAGNFTEYDEAGLTDMFVQVMREGRKKLKK